jgi:hypothetical protein|tara:strand:- start:6782 stop:7183 length:402 start_codon:yes stop_codon:yes gene_type:complete
MKKSDLKQLIKPVVKECIQEVLLEEGLLSNVVSEVVKGMQGTLVENTTKQARTREPDLTARSNETKQKMQEHRKRMMGAIDKDAYNGVNLFEGTAPIAETQQTGQADLGSPGDSGVDISSLMGQSAQIWQKMK